MNDEDKKKPGKNPIAAALILIIAGGLGVAFNLNMIYQDSKFYPKLSCLAMLVLFFGIALIIAPGSDKYESGSFRDKISDAFQSSGIWTRIIWILYPVASFAVTFYIFAVAENWIQIIGVFIGLIAVSGLLAAIRYLYILRTKYSSIQIEEETREPEKYDYFNPSKIHCVIGLVIGLLIACAGAYEFYVKVFPENYTKSYVNERTTYFEEHLDDVVSISIMNYDGTVTAVIDSDEEDTYSNYVMVHLKDLIKTTDITAKLKKHLKNYKGIHDIGVYTKDGLYSYDYNALKRLPAIKKTVSNKEESKSVNLNIINDNNDVRKFFSKNISETVIIKNNFRDKECIMVWDLDGFAVFFNKMIDLPEEDFYSPEELIDEINEGNLMNSTFSVVPFSAILEWLYTNDFYSDTNLILNFGTKLCLYADADIASLYYKEAKENPVDNE